MESVPSLIKFHQDESTHQNQVLQRRLCASFSNLKPKKDFSQTIDQLIVMGSSLALDVSNHRTIHAQGLPLSLMLAYCLQNSASPSTSCSSTGCELQEHGYISELVSSRLITGHNLREHAYSLAQPFPKRYEHMCPQTNALVLF